jgi:hypothetical protein
MNSPYNLVDKATEWPVVPHAASEAISKFLLDGKTGNITLNIKDGVVKCVRAEEITPI